MLEDVIYRFHCNSAVILTYFFLCLIILLIDKIFKGKFTDCFFVTRRSDSLFNPLTYFKLISHSLGHADWDHFYNNFIKILLIGPMIEEKYGSISLLILMISTSFIIGVVNRTFSKHGLYGASGILYMLIVLSSFVNIQGGKIPVTLALIILFFVVDEIIQLLKRQKNDNTSHLGHLTGAFCGLVFGILSMSGVDFSTWL